MPYHGLSASKIARFVGCHPNTVRKYEEWGLIAPVPRNSKGYRLYTSAHLGQMKLARLALNTPFPGSKIRRSTYTIIKAAAQGDLGGALSNAYAHLAIVRSEIIQTEAAVDLVNHWVAGIPVDATRKSLHITQAAKLLGISVDMLYNWERSHLLSVPRDSHSGYRLYGQPEIARLRIIRMLRTAGYSTMSILRMLLQLDHGNSGDIQGMLDAIPQDEEIEYATDHWLTTLKIQEATSTEMIKLLEEQIRQSIYQPVTPTPFHPQ
jgi:DNA-binding transcriptional MerR regulator